VSILDVTRLEPFLDALWSSGGTDLLFAAGSAPRMRVDGKLAPIAGYDVLSASAVADLVFGLLDADARTALRRDRDLDFAFAWGDRARLRGNAYFQGGSVALALRLIPQRIPSFDELRLPAVLDEFCRLSQGLVLVTGPTGSGKTTTIAAMIDRINATRPCHILTIEDPIEYVHPHRLAAVSQREIGVDTSSFASALRAALREDPDVILVGEMRDLETIQFALTIAETGHLVFATLHTNDAAQAIDRMSDVFPPERQAQIRVQLAACLSGVVAQRLAPGSAGGLVGAFEVLIANPAVRNLVRDGKTHQLRNVMLGATNEGMQTLESSLNQLVAAQLVSVEEAIARAVQPRDIRDMRSSAVRAR
jgi:twitching motility protein PilT